MGAAAVRTAIAEMVFEALAGPFLALVLFIYRAIFLLVWFEIILFAVGGFIYDESWHGWSPTACFTNFVDGNVVIHGSAIKAGCDLVGAFIFGKQCTDGEDVRPIFHKSGMWMPARRITAAEIADFNKLVAAQNQIRAEIQQCRGPYSSRMMSGLSSAQGDAISEADYKWRQLTDAERAGKTWVDYFHRIQPKLEEERGLKSCAEYAKPTELEIEAAASERQHAEELAREIERRRALFEERRKARQERNAALGAVEAPRERGR